jgi:putative transposase
VNAFIESFNDRLSAELLNETPFGELKPCPIAIWKNDYNTIRPHNACGNPTPSRRR